MWGVYVWGISFFYYSAVSLDQPDPVRIDVSAGSRVLLKPR